MKFSNHRARIAVLTVVSGFIIATSVATASMNVRQPSRVRPDAKQTCKSTSPCLWWMNDGSGDGIVGGAAGNGAGIFGTNSDTSKNGNGAGVAGESEVQIGVYGSSRDLDGVFGTAAGSGAGVYGVDTDKSSSGNGAGVFGGSQVQVGVSGYSRDLEGVFGTAAGNGAGLYGENTDSSTSGNGAGVFGGSKVQTGVYGSSGVGDGVFGTTAGNGAGVYGENTESSSGTGAAVLGDGRHRAGVVGYSTDVNAGYFSSSGTFTAVFGTADSSSGVASYNNNNTYSALYAEADSATGSPLYVNNHVTKLGLVVDYTGSGYFSGQVEATGFIKELRTHAGGPVKSYETSSTEDTIEDTGSGSLVRGSGVVRFDANFTRAIDASRGYRVLITPDGDNRGLFVSNKGPAGFAVREAQGGRSTLAFDYRVVAYPIGGDAARLPPATVAHAPQAPPRLAAAMAERPQLAPPLAPRRKP